MQPGKNGGYTRNAMIGHPQPRNRLGKGRSKDDMVSTYMWKEETKGKRKRSKESRKR